MASLLTTQATTAAGLTVEGTRSQGSSHSQGLLLSTDKLHESENENVVFTAHFKYKCYMKENVM